jgi:hypothetical protein
MRRGLYRIHCVSGRPNDVRVDDDGITLPLEESLYRAREDAQVSSDELEAQKPEAPHNRPWLRTPIARG